MTRAYRRIKMTPAQLETECIVFNNTHKVGDEIYVATGSVRGQFQLEKIIEPGAYVLAGHTAVVQVTGGHGCVALTHVREPAANAEAKS